MSGYGNCSTEFSVRRARVFVLLIVASFVFVGAGVILVGTGVVLQRVLELRQLVGPVHSWRVAIRARGGLGGARALLPALELVAVLVDTQRRALAPPVRRGAHLLNRRFQRGFLRGEL